MTGIINLRAHSDQSPSRLGLPGVCVKALWGSVAGRFRPQEIALGGGTRTGMGIALRPGDKPRHQTLQIGHPPGVTPPQADRVLALKARDDHQRRSSRIGLLERPQPP